MNRSYALTGGRDISGLAHAIRDYLERGERMHAQILYMEGGGYLVQARARGTRLDWLLGMDRALQVKLEAAGARRVTVEIGAGRWLDKLSGAAIGCFLCWPALLTTAVGVYRQASLPGRVARAAADYLAGDDGEGPAGSP